MNKHSWENVYNFVLGGINFSVGGESDFLFGYCLFGLSSFLK